MSGRDSSRPPSDGEDAHGERPQEGQRPPIDEEPLSSTPSPSAATETAPPRATHPDFGAKYDEVTRVGSGGMGVVYRARCKDLNQLRALKVLGPKAQDKNARSRFKREAQAVCDFAHPNVVRVLDIEWTKADEPYIVMEYVAGTDLGQVLENGEPYPITEAVDALAGISDALDKLHAAEIIHRDIKPGNIIRASDGTLRLTDFGICHAPATGDAASRTLTVAGGQPGTPAYMAPEQAIGEPPTPLFDVYALAVTAFEMVSGAQVYANETVDSLAERTANCVEVLPRPVLAAFARALATDTRRRTSSAGEFHRQLTEALTHSETHDAGAGHAGTSEVPAPHASASAATEDRPARARAVGLDEFPVETEERCPPAEQPSAVDGLPPERPGDPGGRRRWWLAAAALIAALAVALFFWLTPRTWPAEKHLAVLPFTVVEETAPAQKTILERVDRMVVNALAPEELLYGRLRRLDPKELRDVPPGQVPTGHGVSLVVRGTASERNGRVFLTAALSSTADGGPSVTLRASGGDAPAAARELGRLVREELFGETAPVVDEAARAALLLTWPESAVVTEQLILARTKDEREALLAYARSRVPDSAGLALRAIVERPDSEDAYAQFARAAAATHDPQLTEFATRLRDRSCTANYCGQLATLVTTYPVALGAMAEALCNHRSPAPVSAAGRAEVAYGRQETRQLARPYLLAVLSRTHSPDEEVHVLARMLDAEPQIPVLWSNLALANTLSDERGTAAPRTGSDRARPASSRLTPDDLLASLALFAPGTPAVEFRIASQAYTIALQELSPEKIATWRSRQEDAVDTRAPDAEYYRLRAYQFHQEGRHDEGLSETHRGIRELMAAPPESRQWDHIELLMVERFYTLVSLSRALGQRFDDVQRERWAREARRALQEYARSFESRSHTSDFTRAAHRYSEAVMRLALEPDVARPGVLDKLHGLESLLPAELSDSERRAQRDANAALLFASVGHAERCAKLLVGKNPRRDPFLGGCLTVVGLHHLAAEQGEEAQRRFRVARTTLTNDHSQGAFAPWALRGACLTASSTDYNSPDSAPCRWLRSTSFAPLHPAGKGLPAPRYETAGVR